MFPTQGIQYSQICGRIIGYQVGRPGAFVNFFRERDTVNDHYVDGVSLTYGNPRQHIWTFVNALDEYPWLYYRNFVHITAQNRPKPFISSAIKKS
jgi:hypothetical protein